MWKLHWKGPASSISARDALYGLQAERGTSLTPSVRRFFAIAAFIVFALDLLSKDLALHFLSDKPVQLLGSLLVLELSTNSGAAFSLASGSTIFLSLFAAVCIGVLFILGRKLTSKRWSLSLGILLGGICGNLSDRIFRPPAALQGRVIDWIKVPHWPIFNFADVAIVSGILLATYLRVRNISAIDREV